MSGTPSIADLYAAYGERLGLEWHEGEDGSQRILKLDYNKSDASSVGHLNFIHPNLIQILGEKELLYLKSLNEAAYLEAKRNLFSPATAAVLISGGLPIPSDLKAAARENNTPLFSSPLSGHRLSESLHYYVTQLLTEHKIIHGVFMEVMGLGVLLTGKSSIGKSELALELIARGHTLVADDAPEFARNGPDSVLGECPDALYGFMEVRGLGIIDIRAMYGENACKRTKHLNLIIHLERLKNIKLEHMDRLSGSTTQTQVLDVAVDQITLPVAAGRNLAILVEAAIRNYSLILNGYNAAESFIIQQQQLMDQST